MTHPDRPVDERDDNTEKQLAEIKIGPLKEWLNLADEFHKSRYNLVERVPKPQTWLDSYSNGTLEFHIHVGIRTNSFPVCRGDFCARIKHGGEWCRGFKTFRNKIGGANDVEAQLSIVLGKRALRVVVLVAVRESLQNRKRVRSGTSNRWRRGTRNHSHASSYMVRLMPLDDCEEFVADTGESAFDGMIELISLDEDGELHTQRMLGVRFTTDPDSIPCQIIQTSAKVIDGVTQHQHAVCGKFYRAERDDDTLFVCFEVLNERPSRKPFALRIAPPLDVSLESIGVALRPLKFQPHIEKSFRKHNK